jgi:hypothetical protein
MTYVNWRLEELNEFEKQVYDMPAGDKRARLKELIERAREQLCENDGKMNDKVIARIERLLKRINKLINANITKHKR